MKKLVSILLALTMCAALAFPAFAEPAEELPVPEESEVLTCEEDHEHGEVLPAPEDVTASEDVTEPEETVISEETEGILSEREEFAETECEHWHLLMEFEYEEPFEGTGETEGHTVKVEFWEPCDGSCQDPTLMKTSSVTSEQPSWYCLKCGNRDWDSGEVESVVFVDLNDRNVHRIDAVIKYECQTCHVRALYPDKWTEPHSWTKGDLNSCQSVDSANHKATYNYSCIMCGGTKTEPETEPHSLTSSYTGTNFHKGDRHFFEYRETCTKCGYTGTGVGTVSYPCPGPSGGGCITIKKIPGKDMSITPAEEVTEPEETEVPEETVLPEDMPEPEEIEVLSNEELPAAEAAHEHEEGAASHVADTVGAEETGGSTEAALYQQLMTIIADPDFGTDENYVYVLSDSEDDSIYNTEDNSHNCINKYDKNYGFIGYLYEYINDNQHNIYSKYNAHCIICGKETIICELDRAEDHSWSGSATGNERCESLIHKVEYQYTCSVCNGSKTGWESHSKMVNTGAASSNFHKGTRHYFVDEYRCNDCGYTAMYTTSYECPGSPDGTGCIIKFNLEDGELIEGALTPEDVILPKETDTAEETVIPEQTG